MNHRTLLPLLLALALLPACWQAQSISEGAATDVDADTDSDTDSDSDSDSDTEPFDCDGGVYDPMSGLCWQDPHPPNAQDWQEAFDYCDALDLAGHTDWALPTRDDFIDLFGDCDSSFNCDSCSESETCTALFGPDIHDHGYWASTLCDNGAWYGGFEQGQLGCDGYDGPHYIRCMRLGP